MRGNGNPNGIDNQMSASDDNFDEELYSIDESLKKIEQIMIAENKRRIASNQIMNEFIDDYIRKLNESITSKVDEDFNKLRTRVQQIDDNLTNLET